ncbi:transport protein particle (TRAPP) component Bet3 [Plasmodium cynomolgi strain B]|uniref:Transport protein particle (TRAPP) component Bet3 n=1 Tax=Plasmodium cynomolgi (strain B) TaxID=1120755 RepID=K6UL33_PLACD|nr:transport protein particle (TRAPP) component Bet3 [Plasmodium cynomolgi strain B]GAB67368.1 transport protein particle (TRAPP) component Bet3 [Plasmodium cynomolgi strain B]
MSEGMLSKSSLLLLIYEIIKVNNEILQKSELELSSDVSDDDNVGGGSTEKRLPYGEEEVSGSPPLQEGNISGGVRDDAVRDDAVCDDAVRNDAVCDGANGNLLGDRTASPNANKPSGTGKDSPTHPPRSAEEKKLASILSSKLKGMGKDIGRKLIERVLIYKNDFNDLKDIAKLIGRDVWVILFNKNVDKIQTYKKGVYVLIDNDIGTYLNHLLLDNDTNQKSNFTHYVLVLILGIIKGILKRFRMKGSVTYTLDYPTCTAMEKERKKKKKGNAKERNGKEKESPANV